MKALRPTAGAVGPSTGVWSLTPRPTSQAGLVPAECSLLKKIACGGAFVACGASCALGPEICIPCLTGVGATDCLSCLLGG
jgi:hypothetical protein